LGLQNAEGQSRPLLLESDGDVLLGEGGAMLGGEGETVALAAQVEVGVSPAMKLAGTAQGLPRPGSTGVLPGMMNQHHRQTELTLQLAKEG
jgi:hypothetical protein